MSWNKYNFNLNGGLFDGVDLGQSINPSGVNAFTSNTGGLSDFTGNSGGISGIGSTSGWNTFSNILGGVSGLANAFTGFKQLGLAKKQFNWQKDAFNTNLVNQANLVNEQLRRKALADTGFKGTPQEIDAYMAKFGAASSVQEAKERQQQNQNAWNNSKALNNVGTGG